MQFEPRTQLTLTITEGGQTNEFVAFVVGPSQFGLCTTLPQLLHQNYTPATGQPIVVTFMGASGPVEFDSYILGYRGSPVYMVIAEPKQLRRKEQRRFPRIPLAVPVSYLVGGPRPTGDATNTVNLSSGGLCVVTPTLLPRGVSVTIFLDIPQGKITVEGRVAWSTYSGSGNQRMAGFQFTKMDPKDQQMLNFYLASVRRDSGIDSRRA